MLRALALGLPFREVPSIGDSWEHVSSLRALALGLPSRKVLYVALEEHGLLRALALGPPSRELLYVTLEKLL